MNRCIQVFQLGKMRQNFAISSNLSKLFLSGNALRKVLKDTGVHHLRLLHILGRLALFMFLPVWFYMDFFSIIAHPTVITRDYKVLALLFTDGVLNWLQNIIAFSVLSLVTPLTYAVASASKRIFVIGVSLLILGNPVTWVNVFGMVLAILGVLGYNRVRLVCDLSGGSVIRGINVFFCWWYCRQSICPDIQTPSLQFCHSPINSGIIVNCPARTTSMAMGRLIPMG